jgi:hypothetical protein
MSTAMPPRPNESAPVGLSEAQRLVNTFFAPTKTFEDIRRNASWWVPWLLSSILGAAFFFTVDKKIGFETIAQNQMENSSGFLQRAMERMTPEQRSQAIHRQAIGQRIGTLYLSWLISLLSAVILAALLMAIFNFVLEAGIPFRQALSTLFYATLPRSLLLILGMVVLLIGVDPSAYDLENPVASNMAAFLDPTTSSKFLYRFCTFIDIFAVWTVILLGMGFAKQAKKKISVVTGITTVAILFAIYVLGRSGMAAL